MDNFTLSINGEAFLESLKIMGFGMLGIIAVCAVIIGVTMLLNIFTSKSKKKKEDK